MAKKPLTPRRFERMASRNKWAYRGLRAATGMAAVGSTAASSMARKTGNWAWMGAAVGGIAVAIAALKKTRAMNRKMFAMAVGRPMVARKLRERYATSPQATKALANLERLGPLPKTLREKLIKEFDKGRKVDEESRVTATELQAHHDRKLTHIIETVADIATGRGVSAQAVGELRDRLRQVLPMLAMGAKTTQVITYPDLLDQPQTFYLIVEHTPRGFRIRNPSTDGFRSRG